MSFVKTVWGILLLSILIGVIFLLPYTSLSSDKPVYAPFLETEKADKAIVFFGFTRCPDICPTTLATLRNLLNRVPQTQWPRVVFVDIDANSNSADAQRYASFFHPDFIGIHADQELLPKLKDSFGLNIQQQGEQIMHDGRTYLLVQKQRQWHLIKTYNPSTFDASDLEADLF
ncbi:SCO family protein [Aliiglaciecola sp. CAU 1673]|uniref:SCO family protein n=1 Tax=Aliiglaciecola sp. CAU 1673 TaxID=3032595 RepID=UPI0023DC72B3|nr:SCO family protein [Aliiglaciecola sp. CAU 1673]MDF2176631.1 SCO family protein [Aliiglaciecola sp. CAU 1673]